MNHQIRIDKAENEKRKLNRGFRWQSYAISAVRRITKEQFSSMYKNNMRDVEALYENWEGHVHSYIVRKSKELGLWVGGAVGQLVEEPNESKLLEVHIWNSANTHCVFSIHGILKGPVKEDEYVDKALPLFGFWPWDIHRIGTIPEVVDASLLTMREQGVV